jgi:hypothetical protein
MQAGTGVHYRTAASSHQPIIFCPLHALRECQRQAKSGAEQPVFNGLSATVTFTA